MFARAMCLIWIWMTIRAIDDKIQHVSLTRYCCKVESWFLHPTRGYITSITASGYIYLYLAFDKLQGNISVCPKLGGPANYATFLIFSSFFSPWDSQADSWGYRLIPPWTCRARRLVLMSVAWRQGSHLSRTVIDMVKISVDYFSKGGSSCVGKVHQTM